MASLKPRCYLAGCDKPVEHRRGLFHSMHHAAEFGELAAQAKGRHWCGQCRAWVLLPVVHNLFMHHSLRGPV